jgi:hypothetical protein
MDLGLYLRVLWRFRFIVAAGVIVAVGVAFFSYVRIGGSGLTYRQSEEWVSYARVLVTKPDFDINRIEDLPEGEAAPDLEQLTTRAIIYSQLADSDQVRGIMLREGPIDGKIEAAPLTVSQSSDEALPLISIAATADAPEKAVSLAGREVRAFREFLREDQHRNAVPFDQRVGFEVVQEPRGAELLSGRGKTLPVVAFLTVMFAVFGLVFVLDNLRPRPETMRAEELSGTRPKRVA